MTRADRDPDSFDHLTAIYDRYAELVLAPVADYLDRYLPAHAERAVDLGCDTGVHTEVLAGRHQSVPGVDLAPPMLAVANSMRRPPNVSYECRDLQTITSTTHGTFDLVF